jgi:hypothetical protein
MEEKYYAHSLLNEPAEKWQGALVACDDFRESMMVMQSERSIRRR